MGPGARRAALGGSCRLTEHGSQRTSTATVCLALHASGAQGKKQEQVETPAPSSLPKSGRYMPPRLLRLVECAHETELGSPVCERYAASFSTMDSSSLHPHHLGTGLYHLTAADGGAPHPPLSEIGALLNLAGKGKSGRGGEIQREGGGGRAVPCVRGGFPPLSEALSPWLGVSVCGRQWRRTQPRRYRGDPSWRQPA
ncbi:hypothetical protein NDU88_000984 [Pleurodeles waltl]|uniref:Uncharacterized protein n=1 Tax=Pleurodeles waltl TaxID=8319 RepID=A0AAV7LYE8_PLEWA|nr:hypothetical protein NDU88_000984 [Pleurodeles waltl]